jgi:hypothetical protein
VGIDNGLERLETGNDETNAPMRAVNAALGYRPMPDTLALEGPLPQPPSGLRSAANGCPVFAYNAGHDETTG